ncbi:MAG: type II secretion system F family protein [Desulfocucumaceae bacterium]
MIWWEKLKGLLVIPEIVLPALFILAALMSVFVARNIPLFKKSLSRLRDSLVYESSRGDLFFSKYRVAKDTAYKLEKLGAPISYSVFLAGNVTISLIWAVASIKLLFNPPLAGVSALAWILFSHQFIDRLYRVKIKNVIELQAQLMLQLLAELYQVTDNLKQAIESVIPATPQPLKKELENLILNVNTNKDIGDCLVEFAENLDNRDINTFVHGIVLSRQFGSDTHEVIKMVAEIIRERMDLREELINETKGKKVVIYTFMAALPAVFLWMFISSVDAQKVFIQTPKGQALVVMLVIVEYICWFFDNRKGVIEEL